MKQIVVFTFKSTGSQIIRNVLMVAYPTDSTEAESYGEAICEHQEGWFFEVIDMPAPNK